MKTLAILMLLTVGTLAATTTASTEDEIQHLMQYVQKSDAVFIRNGSDHTPTEAADHIQKKREHFKDQIKTAEDFIDLAASRSLVSKQHYSIRMPDGTTMDCGEWLRKELKRYRDQKQK